MIDSQIAGIKKHNFDLLITHVSNYACFVNMLRASLVLIIIIMINIYRLTLAHNAYMWGLGALNSFLFKHTIFMSEHTFCRRMNEY